VPRHHGVLGHRFGRGRVLWKRNCARHQGPGASEASRCRQRSELLVLALGFVLKRRSEGGVYRRVGRWIGGPLPSERSQQLGADAIFRLKDNKLSFANYYKLPAAQGDTENCVAHNGSLIPVPGRDIEVQAWYQGGISVMDFTDAAHPSRLPTSTAGPVDPTTLVLGGEWSAYWYNGRIYASEIARGLDVFELTPTQFLTHNEIDAAKTVRVAELNVQNQQKIEWPAQLVVAQAYLDQLTRSLALPADRIADLQKAMRSAESSHMNKRKLAKLKGMADSLEQSAAAAKNPGDSARLHALAEILKHPAA